MGFWDFLKKLGIEKKTEIELPRKTEEGKIRASEIESFVFRKKEETEKEGDKLLTTIKTRLNQTIEELEKEKKDIENVEIEKHKVEIKIKLIVKQNLDNYVDYLGRLIASLKELDDLELDRLVPRINFLFYDFEKKSVITFQKATFLIGKELEAVRLTNKSFFNDLRGILDSNKELADKARVVHALNEKVGNLKEQDKIIADAKKKMHDTEIAVNLQEVEIKEKEMEMEKIEGTDEHKRIEEIKGHIEACKNKIKQDVNELGSLINFKALGSVFHTNKKKMDIINEYKSNFEMAFSEDKGKRIISLISEAALNNEKINEKLADMEKFGGALGHWESELDKTGKDKIKEIELDIAKERNGVARWEKENEADKKKLEKFESQRKEILDSIKAELIKLKVEVED